MRKPGMRERNDRGHALVEWVIGAAVGLGLAMTAVTVFTQQLQVLRESILRQQQARDHHDLGQHLRRELRRAGFSHEDVRTAEHQALTLEGTGAALQIHYRSDPADPTRQALSPGPSSLRVSQRTLQWRTPHTGGFQSLHDPQTLALPGWSAVPAVTADCHHLLTVELPWQRLGGLGSHVSANSLASAVAAAPSATAHTGSGAVLVIRRRNPGPEPCGL